MNNSTSSKNFDDHTEDNDQPKTHSEDNITESNEHKNASYSGNFYHAATSTTNVHSTLNPVQTVAKTGETECIDDNNRTLHETLDASSLLLPNDDDDDDAIHKKAVTLLLNSNAERNVNQIPENGIDETQHNEMDLMVSSSNKNNDEYINISNTTHFHRNKLISESVWKLPQPKKKDNVQYVDSITDDITNNNGQHYLASSYGRRSQMIFTHDELIFSNRGSFTFVFVSKFPQLIFNMIDLFCEPFFQNNDTHCPKLILIRHYGVVTSTLCILVYGYLIFLSLSYNPLDTLPSMFQELESLYYQILANVTCSLPIFLRSPSSSLLTTTSKKSIFLSPSDLRTLKIITFQRKYNLALSLQNIETLTLNPIWRYICNCAIKKIEAPGPIIAGFIFAGSYLVALSLSLTLLPPSKLSSIDITCIINLLMTTPSLRHQENWIPLCLPIFDHTCFLHIYVNYINDSIAIIYLSGAHEPIQFHAISTFCIKKCIPILKNSGALDAILNSLECTPYVLPSSLTIKHGLLHIGYSIAKFELPSKKDIFKTNNNTTTTTLTYLTQAMTTLSAESHIQQFLTENNSIMMSHDLLSPAIFKTPFVQMFSSSLLNPIDGSRDNNKKKLRRIIRLYNIANSLATISVSETTMNSNPVLPLQILIDGQHERIFCIIGHCLKVFMAFPNWIVFPKNNFRNIFDWLHEQEPYMFAPVSFLTQSQE